MKTTSTLSFEKLILHPQVRHLKSQTNFGFLCCTVSTCRLLTSISSVLRKHRKTEQDASNYVSSDLKSPNIFTLHSKAQKQSQREVPRLQFYSYIHRGGSTNLHAVHRRGG